jgi:transposase
MILGIPTRPGLRIMVAARPVDFRKGMDSLVALVLQELSADPFAGDIFTFRSKRSDRLKVLTWDGSGLCLVTKRLESGGFTWPPVRDGVVTLSTVALWVVARSSPLGSVGIRNPAGAVSACGLVPTPKPLFPFVRAGWVGTVLTWQSFQVGCRSLIKNAFGWRQIFAHSHLRHAWQQVSV